MKYQGLDNKIFCLLPEGVSVAIAPAGISIRSAAYLYDFFIRSVVFLSFAFILNFMGDAGSGINLVVYFFISWGYYIFFESRGGTTPGKKKFNLKIVQDNGLPVTLSNVIIRNLIRPADSFPFAYALGILTMVCNVQFKRIGDWAAGTIVVYEEKTKDINVSTASQGEAPSFSLTTEEQQIIIAYAEQSKSLSKPRQAELANILKELLGVQDEEASEKLKKIAQYYLGQKI